MILAAVAAIGTAAVSAPAEARHRGWGPGIGFGLAAGALAAGAFAASQPYYYNGYYGPATAGSITARAPIGMTAPAITGRATTTRIEL